MSYSRFGPGRQRCPASPPRAVRSWPLLVLALPASVAVWSGWVGIGQMTGFGVVRPLPGIVDSLRIDTAITLPLGVEAYAAYALRAWLTADQSVSTRTRRFARWSAIGSLLLGMAGQVAYHRLEQAGATRAPWEITTLVSCLPVLVLGMGAALAHLLHADTTQAAPEASDGAADASPALVPADQRGPARPAPGDQPYANPAVVDRLAAQDQQAVPDADPDRTKVPVQGSSADHPDVVDDERPADRQVRLIEAQSAAARIAASGRRVSRRTLRAAGIRGSNAELADVARVVSAK
jgi:hypothetical protein